VDGSSSGSCPVAGFGISGIEPWGSDTRELVSGSVSKIYRSFLCTSFIRQVYPEASVNQHSSYLLRVCEAPEFQSQGHSLLTDHGYMPPLACSLATVFHFTDENEI
jgi:hypothetical protein